ncbi:MAG: UDP-N-acetylglucosamine 2-epimerase (non-hydrolyzing) [Croceitalea sp.]|nr:UDP-N-acetylglucosamine 2-epimerase (non-hydrolyzing) [Croceitalea sp.]
MKVITILGARPQFIKASALSREILKRKEVEEISIHTGQHFDANMSEIFFEEMGIPQPKYNLGINSLSHGAMTGRMLEEIERIIIDEKPDWVLVFGDTNSTLAGALAAAKLHIKVAHVEAGLRSYDMKMPEEINRILTDQISDILFCPTQTAIDNLHAEGFDKKKTRLVTTGDIMYDSAMYYRKMLKKPIGLKSKDGFILVTIHRQENTDDVAKLNNIVTTLNKLADKGHHVVWPMHPRTKKKISEAKLSLNFEHIEPVGYLEMLYLLENSSIVITDSGGLQKEAYFFNKYCLTLRDTTEWMELIENNVNQLVKVDNKNMLDVILENLNNKIDNSSNLYGDGQSAKVIVDNLLSFS